MYIVIAVGIFAGRAAEYSIVGCSDDMREVLEEQFRDGDPWEFIDKVPTDAGVYKLVGSINDEPEYDDIGYLGSHAVFRVEKTEVLYGKEKPDEA